MTKVVNEISAEELDRYVSMRAKVEASHMITERFAGVKVDSNVCCQILRISPGTLYKHTRLGNIPLMNPGNGKHQYHLPDILKIDVKTFKNRIYGTE